MSYSIKEIEGIDKAYAVSSMKWRSSPPTICSTMPLQKKEREALAKKSGISEKLILKWANHADLFRIKGIAGQFADLLEASGVDTVKELRHRVAANLHAKLVEVNNAKKSH